jgi:hypothetical protein
MMQTEIKNSDPAKWSLQDMQDYLKQFHDLSMHRKALSLLDGPKTLRLTHEFVELLLSEDLVAQKCLKDIVQALTVKSQSRKLARISFMSCNVLQKRLLTMGKRKPSAPCLDTGYFHF